MVCFEEKIYVIGYNEGRWPRSMKLHVFKADSTFTEIEIDEIVCLNKKGYPEHMEISAITKSLYISDWGDATRGIWVINLNNKDVNTLKLEKSAYPGSLSISSSGELHVVVQRGKCCFTLNTYALPDFKPTRTVKLPIEDKKTVNKVWHAIQSNNGQFIFAYEVQNLKLSCKERRIGILSVHDPRSWVTSIELGLTEPVHLSLNMNGKIFVADSKGNRVLIFDSDLKEFQVVLDNDQYRIVDPSRLFCNMLQGKEQLVVGQWSTEDRQVTLSIFDLHDEVRA